tara:strand:- start:986 stop:1126 length:141 start_codon:yes stop_codon:yes gene_type:complete
LIGAIDVACNACIAVWRHNARRAVFYRGCLEPAAALILSMTNKEVS